MMYWWASVSLASRYSAAILAAVSFAILGPALAAPGFAGAGLAILAALAAGAAGALSVWLARSGRLGELVKVERLFVGLDMFLMVNCLGAGAFAGVAGYLHAVLV